MSFSFAQPKMVKYCVLKSNNVQKMSVKAKWLRVITFNTPIMRRHLYIYIYILVLEYTRAGEVSRK